MERRLPSGLMIFLAAGGTGGHMVPAHALAGELRARGHAVKLVTDERGRKIPGLFEGIETHVLPAGRLGGGPLGWLKAGRAVLAGRRLAKVLYREAGAKAVVGFGGYPAFPALLAASSARIPTILHEQNALLGRVNRLLAGDARAIATAYARVERLKPAYEDKVVLVGNPVRPSVARLGEMPFPPFDDYAPLKILVTGGSQGASVLGKVVPAGLGALSPSLRMRLQVVQQCRPDDIEQVREAYRSLGIPAELMTYIGDMPDKLADAHLVIARAGASTIAELTAAGRPAILVPLPSAADDHQTVNAREMAAAGGARMIHQADFTPETLARQIEALAADPQALANAASRSLSVGRPHAARDLADLVERIAEGGSPLLVGPALEARISSAVQVNGLPA
jgi:UDP-N-acetylglucosamine--N-acetylmuramyl-(pentapeptide) pyrophosphoryl-undecaprenol N-acetylglucosamine transferase